MPQSTSTDSSAKTRIFHDLSTTLATEHSALQGLVQRRLRSTLKSRQAAKAAIAETPVVNPSNAPCALDPLELLELLGELNQPQVRRQAVTC